MQPLQHWCLDLQNKLESLNDSINYEQIFFESAKQIMNNYYLQLQDKKYNLVELEYYYFNIDRHCDPYVHMNCLQLTGNKFYVHKKALIRGGLDLTFGNGKFFGGILIRGIVPFGAKPISGPANSLKNIFSITKDETYITLQGKTQDLSIMEQNNEQKAVIRSKRVGLKQAIHCDKDARYINAQYRFLREDYYNTCKNIVEKPKPKNCN